MKNACETWQASLVGAVNAALLAIPPLAFGGTPRWQSGLLVALLAVAAALEFRLARPEQDRPPRLVLASALALLATFWIALLGPGGGAVLVSAGAALLVLGIALRSIAVATLGAAFVSAHRAARPTTHGIYAHLRHPSETGQLALGLGAAALMGSVPAALAWALVILPLTLVRLRREEAALGESYAAYRASVPALLPFTVRTSAPRARSTRASS